MVKLFFQKLLANLSRKILTKFRPIVIGITGSVGKTSTREAVFAVVSQKYRVRQSLKNYNNEFGLPFTVLGIDSPGRNPLLWLGAVIKALWLLVFSNTYPEVLVLEMGVDKPGDMDYLLSIAKPDIGIITNIGISHYQFFKSSESIELEKGKLATGLKREGTLIVNADNAKALAQKVKFQGNRLSYGVTHMADVTLSDLKEHLALPVRTVCKVSTPSRSFQAQYGAVGLAHASSLAVAVAVGESLRIETQDIQSALNSYHPAPGRLNVLAGIKNSLLIDDTYNASPDSTRAALSVLAQMPQQAKMAVLGDMLELGALSEQSHIEIGKEAAQLSLERLVTVGEGGKLIAQGAKQAGMAGEKIASFDSAGQAQIAVQQMLLPHSAVLIKGSQGVRMEKITKEIMAEPLRAGELLCRQYGKWLSS